MRRALVGLLFLLYWNVYSLSLAQSPPAQSISEQSQPETLSRADSLALLKTLNDKGKLVPDGFIVNVRVRTLSSEDCFGVRLPNNLRLVAHSARQGYGFAGTLSIRQADGTFKPEFFQWVGVLHSEFAFTIDGQQFAPGSYALEAYGDSLTLVGNDENAKFYVARYKRNIAQALRKKLSVKTPIPEDVAKGTQSAPISLIVKEGNIVMSVLENEWKVTPR